MLFTGLKVTQEQITRITEKRKKEFLCDIAKLEQENEEKKMSRCPLYHLLYYPYVKYELSSGVSCCFIDRVLYSAIYVCREKIGVSLEQEHIMKRVIAQLYDPDVKDHAWKITGLFMLMYAVPVVVEFFEKLYHDNHEELAHFKEILPYIFKQIQRILHSGYDIYNIENKIYKELYTEHILKLYTTGPPTTKL